MKNVILPLRLFVLLMAFATVVACEDDDNETQPPTTQEKSIGATAQAEARFSILVDALDRTGLLSVVTDESASLTVFAPNDAAFQSAFQTLGVADLDELEDVIGNAGLKNVLLYHVLDAEVMAADVTTGYVATQATNGDGDQLSAFIDASSGVMLNNAAQVVAADINASNGVIHEIDAVILPLSMYGLLEVNPDFSSLVSALQVADGSLDSLFSATSSGPYTLFAPDDDAFGDLLNALNAASLNELITTIGGTDVLAQVLTYHAVDGNITSDEIPNGKVMTVQGADISIATSNGVSITDGAGQTRTVTSADIQGTNGVIHRINGVLLIQ